MLANDGGMRAAVGEALSAISTDRLPRTLFAQSDEPLPQPPSHWLFVPSPTGYALREHTGPDPARGGVLVLDGVEYRVTRVGGSPFLDGLPCAYLERVVD
jgi:hypothetical protein